MMLQIYRPAPPMHWDWLSIRGPDSEDFLHRLTTVHVRALKPGQGAPGFFLTAQGKIRACFHLWKISPEDFFFEYEAGENAKWKTALLEAIEQFHFGEKFSVESAGPQSPGLTCAWFFGGEGNWGEAGHLREPEHGIRALHHGSIDYGVPWVSAWATSSELLDAWIVKTGAQVIDLSQLERMRIAVARPRMDFEISSETIPLEAAMKEAVSDNKGCYPGQEVIEKIISLGSPARRLVRIDGQGEPPARGEAIFGLNESGKIGPEIGPEIGKITSSTSTKGAFQALGFVRKTHAREGVEVRFKTNSATHARIALVPDYKS